MWFCYKIFNNYGVSLFVITLIAQAAMIPLAFKQRRSMAKNMALQPYLDEVRSQYANNRTKMAEETQRLQQEAGVSMMSSCSSMLINFPIMFGLWDVIYRPLKHIIRFSSEIIDQAIEIASGLTTSVITAQRDIDLVNIVRNNSAAFESLGENFVEKVTGLNLSFFGLDLAATPPGVFSLLALVPITAALLSLVQTLYTQYLNRKATGKKQSGSLMMLVMGPGLSLLIGFGFPVGVTLYWTMRSLLTIVQEFVFERVKPQKELVEEAKADMDEKFKKTQKKKKKKAIVGEDGEKLSQKELNRRKLAEARRRDAERYGEEYYDVTDEDLV